jgi:hypothetical protein
MAESGTLFISALKKVNEADDLSKKRARIRNSKRLHESLRNGFNPHMVMGLIYKTRAGGMSLRQIAELLNGHGFVSPYGKQFYANTVRRLLEDPIDYVD